MNTIDEIYEEIDNKKAELDPIIKKLENKIKIYTNWAWTFVIIGFVVAVIGLLCFFIPSISGDLSLNELGDYFAGTVASSWSLAGLFFIYVAFLGQKQQLINQQIEMQYSQAEIKATRFELAGQKEQLVEQNKTFRMQRFENTFFSLLANHSTIVNDIDIRRQDPTTLKFSITAQGKDCFMTFYNDLYGGCRILAKQNSINQNELSISLTLQSYAAMFKLNQADLGHYFRNLYHILKFIFEEPELTNKKRYSNLLRAQLSSFELILLFYNCLSYNGIEKFKPYIEHFDFLKNLEPILLINTNHVLEYSSLQEKQNTEKQPTS